MCWPSLWFLKDALAQNPKGHFNCLRPAGAGQTHRGPAAPLSGLLGLDVLLETADGLMVKARAYRAHETTRAQRNSQLPVVR